MKNIYWFLVCFCASIIVGCGNTATGEGDKPASGTLVLRSDRYVIKNNGEQAALTTTLDGVELGVDAVRYVVGGQTLQSNLFSSEALGVHKAYAYYGEKRSNEVVLNVIDSLPRHVKNSALICVTAAWCIYCPLGANVVAQAQEVFPGRVVPMFFHRYPGGSTQKPSDPFDIRQASEMTQWLGQGMGLPTLRIDNSYNIDGNSNAYDFNRSLEVGGAEGAPLGLAIETTYDPSSRVLKYKISSAQRSDLREKKLMLCGWLTESGMIWPQAHFKQGVIEDYEHKNVVRAALFDDGCLGHEIPAEFLGAKSEYSYSGEFTLSQEWVADNMYLNVYVYDLAGLHTYNHEILNVQRVKLGQSVSYIYMQ